MYNITLISTHHTEFGKCNSDELYKIIDSISPDVIFEELPADLFDKVYKENLIDNGPLEIKSIKRYLQDHIVKNIPVDIPFNHDVSGKEIDYIFNAFKKYNAYNKIENEQYKMTAEDGFAFLNSKRCEELFEEMRITEKNLLQFMLNKNRLLNIYQLFYEEQEKREILMLQNIYDYSQVHSFNKAIFMLGAGHRKSIMNKIKECEKKQNFKLNWTFYNELAS